MSIGTETNKLLLSLLAVVIVAASCTNRSGDSAALSPLIDTLQGNSLFGTHLVSQQPDALKDSSRIAAFLDAEMKYRANPSDPDALIWYGRRAAYLGDYRRAIELFTEGIGKFPGDARFYRHRGHRYISLREFTNAISDLEKAADLIEGKTDIVEPDGIPNARNTPVSSLNTNIWYHLGLAYYLEGEMAGALDAFRECLAASTNPDMLVATSNWLYMINSRMGDKERAESVLEAITPGMDVFENMAYYDLLLFYKGIKSENELRADSAGPDYMNDAIAYGVGNWYYCKGDTARAIEIFSSLIENGNWASFASISAEADLFRLKEK